jgi:mRNA interferase RelE/StbE
LASTIENRGSDIVADGGHDEGYGVQIKTSAVKDIERLPRDSQRRIDDRIISLGTEPRAHGAIKLAGEDELYRVRVGSYRVIYQIDDNRRIVTVARVKHRKDAYD